MPTLIELRSNSLNISQYLGCSNSSGHAKTFEALFLASELIERIVTHQGLLSSKDVELAIKTMLEQMSQCLATGDRIEIRGFGSFSLHYRAPRVGRNPKTGQSVSLDGKFVPHFKPGKELRDRVNEDEEEGV
eukprot:gene14562-17665_t